MLDYDDTQFDDVSLTDEDCMSAEDEYREDNPEPDCEDQPNHHECQADEEEDDYDDGTGGGPECAVVGSGTCDLDPCSVDPNSPECAARCIINSDASGCPVNCELDPFNEECEIEFCGFPTEMGIVIFPCIGTGNSQGPGGNTKTTRQTEISTAQSFAFSLFRPTEVSISLTEQSRDFDCDVTVSFRDREGNRPIGARTFTSTSAFPRLKNHSRPDWPEAQIPALASPTSPSGVR